MRCWIGCWVRCIQTPLKRSRAPCWIVSFKSRAIWWCSSVSTLATLSSLWLTRVISFGIMLPQIPFCLMCNPNPRISFPRTLLKGWLMNLEPVIGIDQPILSLKIGEKRKSRGVDLVSWPMPSTWTWTDWFEFTWTEINVKTNTEPNAFYFSPLGNAQKMRKENKNQFPHLHPSRVFLGSWRFSALKRAVKS